MNKLMIASVGLASCVLVGCLSSVSGTDADVRVDTNIESKVADWKTKRTPVEPLKSSIESGGEADIEVLKKAIETVDLAPYALYLATTKLLDKVVFGSEENAKMQFMLASYRKSVEEGKTDEEAKKIAAAATEKEFGSDVFAAVADYKNRMQTTDFEQLQAELQAITEKVAAVTAAANDDSAKLQAQAVELAKRLGFMKGAVLTKQVGSDLGVVAGQLTDTGIAVGFCGELLARHIADKAAMGACMTLNATTGAVAAVTNATNAQIVDGIIAVAMAGKTDGSEAGV